MTWDRPYSHPYPGNLDPYDIDAFAQGHASLCRQANQQSEAGMGTAASPPRRSEPSLAREQFPVLQPRGTNASGTDAKPGPRFPNILQKFRSLGLCRSRGTEVDEHCIRRAADSSRSTSHAGTRIDRAQNSPESPDHLYTQPAAESHVVQHFGDHFHGSATPVSPGTRNDFEILANDLQTIGGLGHFPWEPSMGAAEFRQWPPLSPSPWERVFDSWDTADAARAASTHAAASPRPDGAAPSLAGPSGSAAELPQAWEAYGLAPSSRALESHGAVPPAGWSTDVPGVSGMGFHQEIAVMEQQHADLFSSPSITAVNRQRAVRPPVMSTRDVDLRECVVVNTARDEHDSIGTMGVATCFAMCARGQNSEGEAVLGLLHFTGEAEGNRSVRPAEALQELQARMHDSGARNVSMYIVGGMASADRYLSTLPQEWEMLGLRDEFNIQGARLHVNSAEELGEEAYVNVLMTRDRVYFSQNSLYECDD